MHINDIRENWLPTATVYLKGQCIRDHIDAHVFGPIVVSVTLHGSGVLIFSYNGKTVDVPVNRGDVVIMTGEVRYRWMQRTQPARERRVSMTLRTLS